MISGEWKHMALISFTATVLVLAGVMAWKYVNNTYLPMKEARPIITKLSSGSPSETIEGLREIRGYSGHYLPDGSFKRIALEYHKPLRGMGKVKVKQLMLDILATTTNRNILSGILMTCDPVNGGLDLPNHSAEARSIISDAIERFNVPHAHGGFELKQVEDGRWAVLMIRVSY